MEHTDLFFAWRNYDMDGCICACVVYLWERGREGMQGNVMSYIHS